MQSEKTAFANGISKCKAPFIDRAVLIVLMFRLSFSLDCHATYLKIFALIVLFLGTDTALLRVNLLTLPSNYEAIKSCMFSTVHIDDHAGDLQACLFDPTLFV